MPTLIDLSRTHLDGLEFARDARVLSGFIPLSRLERVAGGLLDASGQLVCTIKGEVDPQGARFLLINIQGEVAVCCQRCLGAMLLPLEIRNRLRLIGENEQWPDEELEDDEADAVEAGKEMAVLPLIEEEVLLVLPLAPRHESCEPPVALNKDSVSSKFAVLAQLKKH